MVGHVVRRGATKILHTILILNYEGVRPLMFPRNLWEDNIKRISNKYS
jgi:hypothetical protein